MKYGNVQPAVFIQRPNRFLAVCRLGSMEVVAHVKNTGRCRELLIPGAQVFLEEAVRITRKTPYSLIAVLKGSQLINMDSQAPNRVFAEAWEQGAIDLAGWPPGGVLNREVKVESSRLDFMAEIPDNRKMFIEVKGVTLEEHGVALFPDAPTDRGVRHLHHLIQRVRSGDEASVVFIIQMENVLRFSPHDSMHGEFGAVLRQAEAEGVQIQAYSCRVRPDELSLDRRVPVVFPNKEGHHGTVV